MMNNNVDREMLNDMNIPEMSFYDELIGNAKHDDAGSRLRAASMIMEKCGDKEMSETLRTLSAQMDFDDNTEASAAISRTREKLDNLIKDRYDRGSKLYIKKIRDEELLEVSNGRVTEIDYDFLASSFYKNGLFDPDIFGGSGKIPLYDDVHDKFPTKSFGLGLGHLLSPVHIVLKDDYDIIAQLLGMEQDVVGYVACFMRYLVLDVGDSDCKKFDVLSESEYMERKDKEGFVAGIGGDALYNALVSLNYPDEPERLAFTVIPVVSPVVRPIAYSEGENTFYSFPLNDAYVKVVHRVNRCWKVTELGAPEIILRNEYRILGECVNNLADEAKALIRNTHWHKKSNAFGSYMFKQLELIRRRRDFSIYNISGNDLKKTEDIVSLGLFPETITFCDGEKESSISLESVLDHNDNVINVYQNENAIMVSDDSEELDAATKEHLEHVEETVNKMESYGRDIISGSKLYRESCRVWFNEQEDLYMLVS